MDLKEMKQSVINALEDIKAKDIAVLDVGEMTALFDCMVIASADSGRQAKALADNVQEKLKNLGAVIHGIEGEQTGEWILVDLGAIVVHIMHPTVRTYYNLEELWGGQRVEQRFVAAGR